MVLDKTIVVTHCLPTKLGGRLNESGNGMTIILLVAGFSLIRIGEYSMPIPVFKFKCLANGRLNSFIVDKYIIFICNV